MYEKHRIYVVDVTEYLIHKDPRYFLGVPTSSTSLGNSYIVSTCFSYLEEDERLQTVFNSY